ncbi:hypothetical protein F4804DRAFT_353475 [Jackrogersella minutella]|nr:hypothetical protein F4804DRAFT_353475 [Jackrogersella minutella]
MILPSPFRSLFLLYPTFTAAHFGGFVAHTSRECSQQLDIFSDGLQIPNNTLEINYSIKEWGSHAGGHSYDNMTFPGSASSNDSDDDAGVEFVYWKVDQPDPTCQYILMKDTPRGWQILNKLPGDEILRVSQEGCYYTAVNPNDNLITSYCCGTDDCAIAEIEIQHDEPTDTVTGDAPKCSLISHDSTPTVEDGTQVAVTLPQTCEAPPACTHSITQSRSFSTAISHFSSYTWTTEEGFDVSFEAGVDFFVDTKVKTGMSLSIAQSFMDETGTTMTYTNVTTTQEGGRQMMGTVAFYSFTPQFDCWKGDVSCGKDQDGNEKILHRISFCQPRQSTSGEPAGTYRMVYISG